jgi:hypothetical protein
MKNMFRLIGIAPMVFGFILLLSSCQKHTCPTYTQKTPATHSRA